MKFRWFLGLMAIGLFYLALTPPWQLADEPAHFARALQISRGEILAKKVGRDTGGYFSADIVASLQQAPGGRLWIFEGPSLGNLGSERFFAFNNMAMYSPAPYLPQVGAILLVRLFNGPLFLALALARLCGWAVSFGLLWVSFRWMEARVRWAVLLALCTPMGLWVMSSCGADSFLLGLAALGVGWLVRLREVRPGALEWIGLLAFSLVLSFSKLVMFFIPLAFVPSVWRWRRWRGLAALLGAALVPNIVWSVVTKPIYSPLRDWVDANAQMRHLMERPLDFASAMMGTLGRDYQWIVSTWIGNLGWLDVPVRYSQEYGWLVFTLLLIGSWGRLPAWNNRERAWLLVVSVGLAVLVFFSQYLAFSPVGGSFVEGISGRYLIPSITLLLVAIPVPIQLRGRGAEAHRFLFLGAFLFIHLKGLGALLRRYWLG